MNAPIASGGAGIYPATAELAEIHRWVCWKRVRRRNKVRNRHFALVAARRLTALILPPGPRSLTSGARHSLMAMLPASASCSPKMTT